MSLQREREQEGRNGHPRGGDMDSRIGGAQLLALA